MSWEDKSVRIDPYSGTVIWRQVADDIAADIASGKLASGSRLPGESELASIYGVARSTVRRAIQDLRSRNLVATGWGKGTIIR